MTFENNIPAYPAGPHGLTRLAFADGGQNSPAPQAAGGEKGLSFADLVDVVNPLQHIPGLSSIYRRISGDEMGAAAKIAGGALFGGVIGLAASIADTVVGKLTGADTGEHLMTAMLGKDKQNTPATTMTAAAQPARATVTVHPKGHAAQVSPIAPNPLDPAAFNALAATLGGPEALAHLAPKPTGAETKNKKSENQTPAPGSLTYDEALNRMRLGLDRYSPIASDKAMSID